jgi:hypothetical protein
MRRITTRNLCLAIAAIAAIAMPTVASAQNTNYDCGNAGYDDGTSVGGAFFGGFQAGDPDKMYAVFFALSDFGYEPGSVEIYGICAGGVQSFGGLWPNRVYVMADDGGLPDDTQILAEGTILTGNGQGDWAVMFDHPVPLHGDFWLVNRGYVPFTDTDFNMEFDAAPDTGHSFLSETGIADLEEPVEQGDYLLRAYLRPRDRSYAVAGIARAAGAGDTQWRSTLGLLNTGDMTAEAMVHFVQSSGTATETVTLAPGELRVWQDVVEQLFGLTGSTSGSLQVDADRPVIVTARTFNQGDAGTFGQFLPGATPAEMLSAGQHGILSQLSNSAAFRTNVGFVNPGDAGVGVSVQLYDAAGSPVGSPWTGNVGPGAWRQINDVFGTTGAGSQDAAYAIVEVTSANGSVWAYASVVDNATGDPTTIPVIVQ